VGIGSRHSSSTTVIGGVPQGSVLGQLLFILFNNDVNDGISLKISKFADDMKLCRQVGDDKEKQVLREDIRRMFRWSQDWQCGKCSLIWKHPQLSIWERERSSYLKWASGTESE